MSTSQPVLPQPVPPERFRVRAVVAHSDGQRVLSVGGALPGLSLGGAVFHGEGVAEAFSATLQTRFTLLRRLEFRAPPDTSEFRVWEAVWTLDLAGIVSCNMAPYDMAPIDLRAGPEWRRPGALPPAEQAWALQALAPIPAARPLWQRPGGWDTLLAWLDDELAAQGRPRSGEPQILKHWQISLLLRVPTQV